MPKDVFTDVVVAVVVLVKLKPARVATSYIPLAMQWEQRRSLDLEAGA